jgi:hypothetical protein
MPCIMIIFEINKDVGVNIYLSFDDLVRQTKYRTQSILCNTKYKTHLVERLKVKNTHTDGTGDVMLRFQIIILLSKMSKRIKIVTSTEKLRLSFLRCCLLPDYHPE